MPKRPSPPRTNSISASPIETTRGLCSFMPAVLCEEVAPEMRSEHDRARRSWQIDGRNTGARLGFGGAGTGQIATLYCNKSPDRPNPAMSLEDREFMPTQVPHHH